ncbi:hypothetical protein ACOME3_003319 [Neoechinorhynchus agilis]
MEDIHVHLHFLVVDGDEKIQIYCIRLTIDSLVGNINRQKPMAAEVMRIALNSAGKKNTIFWQAKSNSLL